MTIKGIENRFWSKVQPTGFCWEWVGGKSRKGYGMIGVPKGDGTTDWTKVSAHRYAYEQLVGAISPGLVLDHLCRNPSCVNPDHLEPVTVAENTMRSPLPSARTILKRYCDKGHPLSGENVRRTARQRTCIACARRRSTEWARRKRAERAVTT